MQKTPDVELLGPAPLSRFGSVIIWLCVAVLIGLVIYNGWRAGIGTPGNGWASLFALVGTPLLFAALLQYNRLSRRDVALSVEGVRKGKGAKSKFIPWRGATFYYDLKKDRYVIAAKGMQISFNRDNFSSSRRYAEVIGYILYVIQEQGLRRNAKVPKISAPLHRLSAADRAEFLAYAGGDFFSAVWFSVALFVFVLCVAYMALLTLLIARLPLPSDTVNALHTVKRMAPLLFHGWIADILKRFCLPAAFVSGLRLLPDLGGRKRVQAMRTNWLEQFDHTQVVTISEVGLTCQIGGEPMFIPWSDVFKIGRTRGLILFHLTAELTLSIALPKRVFQTTADATSFYRKAEAFRIAALATPNIVEPISFWEIA